MSRCAAVSAASMVRRYLRDDMGDDGLAVADRLAVVDEIRKLPARRRRRIENMLVRERHAGKPQEGEYLEPVAVVVGDAE